MRSVAGAAGHDRPQRLNTGDVNTDQRHTRHRQVRELDGQFADGGVLLAREGFRDDVAGEWLGQQSIDHVLLVDDPEIGELGARARSLAQCRALGPAHQHDRRPCRIAERRDRRFVQRTLGFRVRRAAPGSSHLAASPRCSHSTPPAGSTTAACAPSARCRTAPDRTPTVGLRIGHQGAERIKGGHLHGALPRQLLLDAAKFSLWHRSAQRREDLVAVRVGRGLRVDVHRPTGARSPVSPSARHRCSRRRHRRGSRPGPCSRRAHGCRRPRPRPRSRR